MAKRGIGKFGDNKSYNVGDAVWIKDCPRDGVAHIIKFNDGSWSIAYGMKPKKGTYEIQYNSGAGIIQVDLCDLKLATPEEDAKDQARIAKQRQEAQDALDRQAMLMEKLVTMDPLVIDEDDPRSYMQFMMTGFSAMLGGDPDAADLEALRFQDATAVSMGRSLGYCGTPRTDYSPGERVRIREGVNEEFWQRSVGMTGIVLESDEIMKIFPVNPMQPKSIKVQWDDNEETMIYVTNLEPE